jgi:CHAD domain-containing protein
VEKQAMPDNNSKQVDKMLRKFELFTELVTQMATPETVHDLRTTSRRIQTMVQAHELGDHSSGRKLLKQLHRLRSRAGKVRDIDVQLLALETIPGNPNGRKGADGSTGSADERHQVQQYLRRSRAKQTDNLAGKADSELSRGLVQNLADVGGLLETSGGVDEDLFLRAGLDQFARIADEYSQLDEKNLHEFRKQCKHARYTLEMAGDNKRARQAIGLLKEIQDKVGDWHDWVNLTGSVQKVCSDNNSSLLTVIREGCQKRFSEALAIARDNTKSLLALRTKPLVRENRAAKVA